jgi:hypothetical protein
MSDGSLEYDVFISFASSDQELVRPIWQELSAGGLRVFWSDAALRAKVGASWFEVVQDSLERSRHMLLVCTEAALASQWVKREYVAFYSHCYRPPDRLLVPLLSQGVAVSHLPLFLRELEACHTDDLGVLTHLCDVFGGTDIAALRRELRARTNENRALRDKVNSLEAALMENSAREAEYHRLLECQTSEMASLHSLLANHQHSRPTSTTPNAAKLSHQHDHIVEVQSQEHQLRLGSSLGTVPTPRSRSTLAGAAYVLMATLALILFWPCGAAALGHALRVRAALRANNPADLKGSMLSAKNWSLASIFLGIVFWSIVILVAKLSS